ncbi:MAG: hypothetical protein FD135_1615 [Comamonadaceae bacterium]|nr:MAG: hypothetical protein FD135_1615 [Comamonadaceae bacterium]
MKHMLWLLKWVLKAAIFFTLFAFALNNQQDTTVHFFFGNQWRAPQVLVVLSAFSVGVLVGVLGMLPRWIHQHTQKPPAPAPAQDNPVSTHPGAGTPGYVDGI